MSAQNTAILTHTVSAAGVIAANRFVTPLGAQAGADANILGAARFAAAAAGEKIPVDVLGTAVVEAGAAIAAGATVKSGRLRSRHYLGDLRRQGWHRAAGCGRRRRNGRSAVDPERRVTLPIPTPALPLKGRESTP
jgi:hypothetical protein